MQPSRDQRSGMIWRLLRIWGGIGLQSFGGGASTQLLIRREFVERRDWVGEAELGQMWNLCQFTPGINLIALAILIGRKLGGRWGIAASLGGMLLPSAAITCLLAAGFEAVRDSSITHAVLRGIVPATAGMMGVVAVGFVRPLLGRVRHADGAVRSLLSAAVILFAAVALIVAKLSTVAVLAGSALLGVALFTPEQAVSQAPPDSAVPGIGTGG